MYSLIFLKITKRAW